MSSSRKWFKARRAQLFKAQNGLCHWCSCQMVLVEGAAKRRKHEPNQCTVDHLRDRWDPTRSEPARGEQRYVAACRECNNRRGREREAAQPVGELRRRCGRGQGAITA